LNRNAIAGFAATGFFGNVPSPERTELRAIPAVKRVLIGKFNQLEVPLDKLMICGPLVLAVGINKLNNPRATAAAVIANAVDLTDLAPLLARMRPQSDQS
jgi:hypothetical protein